MSPRRAVAWVVALVLLVTVTGCSGAQLQQVTAERDQYQSDVAELQERVKSLEAEVAALKDAPQEIMKQAVEAREKGDFDQAAKMLDDLEKRYPASPEGAKVPTERGHLKQAIAAQQQADRKAYEVAVAKAQGEATPEKAKAALEEYLSQNPKSTFRADVEKKIAANAEQIRIAAEEAKKPPVVMVSAIMDENSIGTPEIHLTIRNVSKKVIDGFEFAVDLYDNYDRPVYHYRIASDGNTFRGISQDKISPGGQGQWYWPLYGYDLATKYKDLRIRSVHFTDGTTWRP